MIFSCCWISAFPSCIIRLQTAAAEEARHQYPFRAEEDAKTLSDMHSNMILVGFLIILICQDLVAVKAFQRSVRDGILCAVVPGYILIYASRGESRQVKPLIGWLAGLGILLMGLVR